MKILRRGEAAESDATPDEAEVDVPVGAPGGSLTAAKGRPTPKRRDSTVPRGPVAAPKTRKEAAARRKQARDTGGTARRGSSLSGPPLSAAERREAMRRGDPAYLPKRDQGKDRKLARDYVDSRRMLSNFLLLLFPLMIVSYLVPFAQIVVLGVFVLVLIEWYFTGRKLRGMALERGYPTSGGPMTLGFYAGSRAYLPRRWRMPAPQVKRGDTI